MLKSLHIFLLSLMLLVAPLVAQAGLYAVAGNMDHVSHCVEHTPASTPDKQIGHGSSCQSMCLLSAYAPAAGLSAATPGLINQVPMAAFAAMQDGPAFHIYKPPKAFS